MDRGEEERIMRIRAEKSRLWLLVAVLLVLALAITACGGKEQPAAGGGASQGKTVEIKVGTAPSGSVFYALGVKLSEVIPAALPNYKVTAQPTGATVENIRRMSTGELDIAFTYGSNIYWANAGEKVFKEKYPVRVLVGGHLAPWVLLVREDAGITSWKNLKGKRIANAPPGGLIAEEVWATALEYYGLTPKDLATVTKIPNVNETVEQIKNKQLDGLFWPTARGGMAPFIDLARSTKTRWLGFDEEAIKHILAKYPFLVRAEVPVGTNEGQANSYVSVSDRVHIVAMEKMDEEVAYNLTKAIVENNRFAEVMPAGSEWTRESAVASKGTLEYHPGAIKYYKEIGIWDK